MANQVKTLVELTDRAISLLYREMGMSDTMRFLNQFTTGYGNYTEERELLNQSLNLDAILSAIRAERKEG
ncbi:MAG: hypothetical protein HY706_12360 [Candidatus Hydrogenedentes bacterium]|nr:hypothetical protein [Candidatus Hydrogenedentota bacterium]